MGFFAAIDSDTGALERKYSAPPLEGEWNTRAAIYSQTNRIYVIFVVMQQAALAGLYTDVETSGMLLSS